MFFMGAMYRAGGFLLAARGGDEAEAGGAPMVAVHRVAADCSAVLGHGGRLRNSLSFGSSNSPRRPLAKARGNPPWPALLDAPEVAPPASDSSLIAPLVA